MRLQFLREAFSILAVSALCGCVSPLDETTSAVRNAEKGRSESTESTARDEKRTEPTAEKSAPAQKTAAAEPARREGRPAGENRPAADSARPSSATGSSRSTDAARAELVAQLNEATRELATLRAANARLRAERGGSGGAAASSSSSSPADEKLATLRSYTQFKQELAAMVADVERLRSENATLSAQVKELRTKSDQSTAAAVARLENAIGRLEKDLQAERTARAEAERAATALRDQLRAVARAVNAAGVSK